MYKIIPSAYIFTHIYLNTMQQGIQPLHVIGEMFVKYGPETQGYTDAIDWAKNHKVVRLLNGGGSPDFEKNRHDAFKIARDLKLPYVSFQEPDCFNQITSFGMIVTPEAVHELEQAREALRYQSPPKGGFDPGHGWGQNDPHDNFPLVQFLKKFRSAK